MAACCFDLVVLPLSTSTTYEYVPLLQCHYYSATTTCHALLHARLATSTTAACRYRARVRRVVLEHSDRVGAQLAAVTDERGEEGGHVREEHLLASGAEPRVHARHQLDLGADRHLVSVRLRLWLRLRVRASVSPLT